MIIMDLSQVMLANLHAQIGTHSIVVDENILRHMILNSIRANYKKFKGDYGELIIACDSNHNWRRDIFPYYKANRKKNREESKLDWTSIFESLNKVREELKEYFPYRVITVDNAEADDIIGTLCLKYGKILGGEKILIISGDKDFKQLQKFNNIKQYDPTRKRWLDTSEPEAFLFEHILRGDKGDGVPNFQSPDDSLVSNTRQKKLYQTKIDEWVNLLVDGQDPKDVFANERELRNFKRNSQLINLEDIPDSIRNKVNEQYAAEEGKSKGKLFNYFIKYKLRNLTEAIGDF